MMPTEESAAPMAPMTAWMRVAGAILLSCLLIGYPNFVIVTHRLAGTADLERGALVFLVIYAVCVAAVVGLLLLWGRSYSPSLREMGWRKPSTPLALVLSALLGAAWLALSLAGAHFALRTRGPASFLSVSGPRLLAALLGLWISAGEEIIMRGFVMSQLHRARIAPWVQILVSGAGFALYHSLGNFSLPSLIPSFIFSALLAGLYVLGRRSLGPGIFAHGIVNVLGEPYLAMMILAVYAR
jgi:membrane protease YdiL (CAAX protease family)